MSIGDGIAFGCCIMGVTYLAGLLARFTHDDQRERRAHVQWRNAVEEELAERLRARAMSAPTVIPLEKRRGDN